MTVKHGGSVMMTMMPQKEKEIRWRCCGTTLNRLFMFDNVAEFKQSCKEEWTKIPPLSCERLIITSA